MVLPQEFLRVGGHRGAEIQTRTLNTLTEVVLQKTQVSPEATADFKDAAGLENLEMSQDPLASQYRPR